MALTADLGGIPVGEGCPVRVMAVLNVSPESFYLLEEGSEEMIRLRQALV